MFSAQLEAELHTGMNRCVFVHWCTPKPSTVPGREMSVEQMDDSIPPFVQAVWLILIS